MREECSSSEFLRSCSAVHVLQEKSYGDTAVQEWDTRRTNNPEYDGTEYEILRYKSDTRKVHKKDTCDGYGGKAVD